MGQICADDKRRRLARLLWASDRKCKMIGGKCTKGCKPSEPAGAASKFLSFKTPCINDSPISRSRRRWLQAIARGDREKLAIELEALDRECLRDGTCSKRGCKIEAGVCRNATKPANALRALLVDKVAPKKRRRETPTERQRGALEETALRSLEYGAIHFWAQRGSRQRNACGAAAINNALQKQKVLHAPSERLSTTDIERLVREDAPCAFVPLWLYEKDKTHILSENEALRAFIFNKNGSHWVTILKSRSGEGPRFFMLDSILENPIPLSNWGAVDELLTKWHKTSKSWTLLAVGETRKTESRASDSEVLGLSARSRIAYRAPTAIQVHEEVL